MKKHLKLILRTLISNNACVEAARTKEPKYTVIGIIFVLLALFFAALPTCVTGFQQQGGNILRGITYDFDSGMRAFGDETKKADKNITFELNEVNNQHTLTANNWDKIGTYTWGEGEFVCSQPNLNCFMYTHSEPNSNATEHKVLEIYHCDMDSQDDFTVYIEEIVKNINPMNIIGKYEKGDNKKKEELEKLEENWLEKEKDKDGKMVRKSRSTSFIVFGKRNVQMALYQPTNSSGGSGCYGDYNNTPVDKDLIHNVLVKEGATPEEILKANQKFFDQVYVNPRFANTWRSTGIILAVDTGIILLMGFMVWILTRGKNNPFRIYSFWDGQKIAYYACLTPGIISLFGFLMSNMAMMLFILGVGVRVMWLSMRTLRYQAPNKQ